MSDPDQSPADPDRARPRGASSVPSPRRIRRRLVRAWHDLTAVPRTEATRRAWADINSRHPRLFAAVAADARITASRRGERFEFRSRLDLALQVIRLCLVTEAFFAQCCYRLKTRCRARGIPFVPVLLDRLALSTGNISIGDPVVIEAGVTIPHGYTIIAGFTRISSGAVISPFTSVGLLAGNVEGPTIGPRVFIGTGARVLGPVKVGANAVVAANAVVVSDVASGSTVGGVPARVISGGGPRSSRSSS